MVEDLQPRGLIQLFKRVYVTRWYHSWMKADHITVFLTRGNYWYLWQLCALISTFTAHRVLKKEILLLKVSYDASLKFAPLLTTTSEPFKWLIIFRQPTAFCWGSVFAMILGGHLVVIHRHCSGKYVNDYSGRSGSTLLAATQRP